jgi:drug/metabolite transporter (DMT)-like permease
MTENSEKTLSRAALAACYFAVYIIWGSTYLAMSVSFKTTPILLANAMRFLSAGVILALAAHWKGAPRPTGENLSVAAKSGALSFFVAFSLLSWAQKTLPSSTAALLVSLEPAWFIIFDWLFFGGPKPLRSIVAAQTAGILGCAILVIGEGTVSPSHGASPAMYAMSSAAVIVSSFSWVYGALLSSKSRRSHPNAAMASGLQMAFGGAAFAVVSACFGDFSSVGGISGESWLAVLYLIVFGSVLTYSAYVLLLRTQPASRVSTHTFVNPLVALVLGAVIAGEKITVFTAAAAFLIVSSVAMIILRRR